MNATTKAEKLIAAIESLRNTGIPLLGRVLGRTNNGSAYLDIESPSEEIVVFAGISEIYRWGRYSAYGDKRTALIVELRDGTLYWVPITEQDSANKSLARKVLSTMPSARSHWSDRTSGIEWHA